MLKECLESLREQCPLVHNITNYVTVNDCANILLAAGASPIMADEALEVEEITTICNSLNLNIGTVNERAFASMLIAGKKANQLGHPVVIDLVGVGASTFRKESTLKLLRELSFTAIKGNASELKAIATNSFGGRGVDANSADQHTESLVEITRALSKQYGAVVIATGVIDVISKDDTTYLVHNGHAKMSKITGTGCMLSALMGAFMASNMERPLEGAVTAVVMMGVAGERAFKAIGENGGSGSFRVKLIDSIDTMTSKIIEEEGRYELYSR